MDETQIRQEIAAAIQHFRQVDRSEAVLSSLLALYAWFGSPDRVALVDVLTAALPAPPGPRRPARSGVSSGPGPA